MFIMKLHVAYSTVLSLLFIWCSVSEAIVVPKVFTYENVKSYKTTYSPRTEVEFQSFTAATPCLIRFLRENLPSPDRVTILIPNSHISPNTQYFLKALQLEMSVFILQDKFNSSDNYVGILSILLLLDDISVVENVSSDVVYICSRKCVYVTVLTKYFESRDNFMAHANLLVQLLWERKIANVAIASIVGDSVQLAKSLSFKPDEIREPAPPQFFGSYKETNGWEKEKDKILSPLILNDSVAQVAFFQADPYVIISNDSDTVTGIEGDLLNVVSSNLKLQLVTDEISWTSETDDEKEIKLRLYSNQSFDMVLGGLQWSPSSEIDYTLPYQVTRMVWLIPVIPNVSLRGLIAPFQNDVWYAVGAVLVVTIIIKNVILHDITFLDVFALIIGTSASEQPEKLSSRIQFLSWAIFGYVLSQSYLASLAGVLVEESHHQIQTMEELVFTGIQYGGLKRQRELFAFSDSAEDSDTDDLSNSDIIQTIYKNFVVLKHEEYLQKLQDLITGKNQNMALVAMMNFSSYDDFDQTKVQRLREPLASYPLAFAVWKGLPYLDQIDRKIMALTEGGFVEYWERRYVAIDRDLSSDDSSSDVLGFAQFVPGFLLLIIGALAGIVALFCEIILYTYRRKQIVKQRVQTFASTWLRKTRMKREKKWKTKNQISKYKKVKIDSMWDYSQKRRAMQLLQKF